MVSMVLSGVILHWQIIWWKSYCLLLEDLSYLSLLWLLLATHFVTRVTPLTGRAAAIIRDGARLVEDVIRRTFLPALLKISPPNDVTRRLLALPPRWGGLGIFVPTVQCELEYTASLDITGPLIVFVYWSWEAL